MKVMNLVKDVTSIGSKVAGISSAALATADRAIHYKEYKAKKARNRAIAITLGVIGGILVVLFFPYKVKVKKNGDFELKSLMLKVSRKTVPAESEVDVEEAELEAPVEEAEIAE